MSDPSSTTLQDQVNALADVTGANPPPPNQRTRLVFPTSSDDDDDDSSNNNKAKKESKAPVFVPVRSDINFSTNEEDFVDPLLYADVNDRNIHRDQQQGNGEQEEDPSKYSYTEYVEVNQTVLPVRRNRYAPPTTADLEAAAAREQQQQQHQTATAAQQQQPREPRQQQQTQRRGGGGVFDDGDDANNNNSDEATIPHWKKKYIFEKDGYNWNLNPSDFYHDPISSRDDIITDHRRRTEQTFADEDAAGAKEKEDADDDGDDDGGLATEEFKRAVMRQNLERQQKAQQQQQQPQPGTSAGLPQPPPGTAAFIPAEAKDLLTQLSSSTAAVTGGGSVGGGGGIDNELDDDNNEEDEDDEELDEEEVEEELDELLLVESVRQMVKVCLEQLHDTADEEAGEDQMKLGAKQEKDDDAEQDKPTDSGAAILAINEAAASGRAHRAHFERFVAVAQPLLAALEEGKIPLDEFVDETAGPMIQLQRVLQRWSRPPGAPKTVIDGKELDF